MPTFEGTNYTHEITVDGSSTAYATDLAEAKIVARAISRAAGTHEVRIYPAFAALPHSTYRAGWQVR